MNKVFIIAELSANHNHDLSIAIDSIKTAAQIGADAVKIQTYTPKSLTLDCRKDDFIIKGGLWKGRNYYDLYQEAATPWEWHETLFQTAREAGITLFSTPFDKEGVDLLESLGNPIYKIASFEIAHLELIRYAASKGKPMIISTGIATLSEIEEAIQACREVGNNDITLLKCTSEYPAKIEDANLSLIPEMKEKFNVKTGLSDHAPGSFLPVLAVGLGAVAIEKHFILDKIIGGPDAGFSLDKTEFAAMVKDVRLAEKALGFPIIPENPESIKGREHSRSLYVGKDIKKGDLLTEENVACVRPGFGLHPRHFREIIGKHARRDLHLGDRISPEDIY